MASLTIGGKTVFTQSGTDEPVLSSNAVFPAGHIIKSKFRSVNLISQNVTSGTLTQFTNNTVQEYYVAIDNLTIGNAVAMHFWVAIHIQGSSSIANGGLGVFRDTTKIYETDTDAFQNYQGTSSSGARFSTIANILFIDTNFSTTSHTYYLGGRMGTGDWIRVESNVPSTFLAQEIQQ